MTTEDIWTATVAAIITLGIICLWVAITAPLAVLVGRVFGDREAQDRRVAVDHGEPTRRDVENAYGPLVLYGPSGEAYDGTVDLPRRGRTPDEDTVEDEPLRRAFEKWGPA